MRDTRGVMLSEMVFLLLIFGSLLAVFWFNRDSARTSRRSGRAERTKAVAYLTRVKAHETAVSAGGSARRGGTRIGGSAEDGVIVATEPIDPALLVPRPATGASRSASPSSGGSPSVSGGAVAVEPGRSIFVSSKRGLPIFAGGEDVWNGWEDLNTRNIGGTQGMAALGTAFDLAADSRARRLIADLTRKGVEVAFGVAEEFSGEHAGEIATFDFSDEETPGRGAPVTPPKIRFNPAFIWEDPKVLAAALVHEATHFQQFLDGTLFQSGLDHVELELVAWSNEAAFWDEVRGGLGPLESVLEAQAEFAYKTALRGEAALRDLLEALHG